MQFRGPRGRQGPAVQSLLSVSCLLSRHSRTDGGRSPTWRAAKRTPHPSPRGHSPQRRSETLGPQPRPARTCSLLSSTASVVLLAPGLAAFQNCFWAEYRFMGHSLKRQSRRERNKMCYGGRTHPGTGKPSPGTLRGRYQLRVAQGPFQTPPLTMNSRHHNVRLHMRKLRLLEGKPVVT